MANDDIQINIDANDNDITIDVPGGESSDYSVDVSGDKYYLGMAKDWAVKMDGKVAGEDYSSKYYATRAKAYATSAQSSAEYVVNNAPTATVEQTATGAIVTTTDLTHGTTTAVLLNGEKGETGEQGPIGVQGETGATGNGIDNISLISTVGLQKTYRITYTDGTHFDYIVTDGNGTVNSVNNIQPVNGNVTLSIPDADNVTTSTNSDNELQTIGVIDDNSKNAYNFTVVGSPTITADGIASGFSSSNYITMQTPITPVNSLDITFEVDMPSNTIAHNNEILTRQNNAGGFWFQLNYNGGAPFYQLALGNSTTSDITGWASLGAIDFGKKVIFNLTWNGNVYKFKKSLDNGKTFTELGSWNSTLPIGTDIYNIGKNGGDLTSIDLKQFSITVDGVEVYRAWQPPALKYWTGTSAQYSVIATKGSNTLYFLSDVGKIYFGNIELFNDKADTDLTNVTDTGYIKMAKASMPSNRYIDLTLGASDSTYIAPADGWVFFDKRTGGTNQVYEMDIAVLDTSNNVIYRANQILSTGGMSAQNALSVVLPVLNGQTFKVNYNLTGETLRFRFIYAKGSESEAL